MTLTIIFFTAALLIIFKHYHLIKSNYDKYPDSIPVRFGIRGKANAWGKKNFSNAYLLFIGILVAWINFLIVSIIIGWYSNNPLAVLSLGGAFMCYNYQRGIVKYILKEIDSTSKYLLIGLTVFFCSVIIAFIAFR